jgi:hypothetical protein
MDLILIKNGAMTLKKGNSILSKKLNILEPFALYHRGHDVDT